MRDLGRAVQIGKKSKMTHRWSLGLMTGTVLDGYVDIALIRTDGLEVLEFGPWALVPYPVDIQDLLLETFEAARAWGFKGPEPEIFAHTEQVLSKAQSLAVKGFLSEQDISPADVEVIGFHGQTVLHAAPQDGKCGNTRQLGDGRLMADMLGIDVVYDLRSADVKAGGQGAPLAAIYHKALLQKITAGPETAVLNLGGVGNLTWCDPETGDMVAFDTGPANAPVNDWVKAHQAGDMDVDGALAAKGQVNEGRLKTLLQHPYLAKVYPKSLDRFDFEAAMAQGENLEDGAALLTAFTASAVGAAFDLLPKRPSRLVVCGGGRKNPTMMRFLAERTKAKVINSDDVGWRGDAIEAECFAYLAARSLRGLPISFPLTTGVPHPMSGGRLARHKS